MPFTINWTTQRKTHLVAKPTKKLHPCSDKAAMWLYPAPLKYNHSFDIDIL